MTSWFKWLGRGGTEPRRDGEAAECIQRGNAELGAGRPEAAANCYREALTADPGNVGASVNLGFVLKELGRTEEAETYLGRVIELEPSHADAHYLLGLLQEGRGELDGAIRHMRQALESKPDFVFAWRDLCRVSFQTGRIEEALEYWRRFAGFEPNNPEMHNIIGNACFGAKRYADALACFDLAIKVAPDRAEAHFNRGTALKELGRYDEALGCFERAIGLKGDLVEAHNNRGNVLQQLRRFSEALASYGRALDLRPDAADVLCNCGNALHELERYEEALASFDRALTLRGEFADAYYNRGNTLKQMLRFEEALASYDRAIALAPQLAAAFNNRGLVLHELSRLDAAAESYRRALALEPDNADAHWNLSLTLLLQGDFAAGWREYEWRWRRTEVKDVVRVREQPLWLGESDLHGRTILLHAEQGLGDTIQFCRYVPRVAALGANVVLEVQPALVPLLGQVEGVARLVGRGEELPAYDCHCPLLSLPLAFKAGVADITGRPYLRVPSARGSAWEAILGERSIPRIGLVWSGSTGHQNDRNRSIPFAEFRRIFQRGISYHCLQKEIRPADRAMLAEYPEIRTFEAELRDFADTAALIAQMDLVITVDTSVAHLAGAMGKETWVLLPFMPDWRWLLQRTDSPWYDSVRLFRQPAAGDWQAVLDEVARMTAARYADRS